MKRRDLLIGSMTAAIAGTWSRVAGAVRIARPPSAPLIPSQFLSAGDHLDRIWRDMRRRLIDEVTFHDSFKHGIEVLGQSNRREIDDITAANRMLDIHFEALMHPEPSREIPPLPADQVGVGEVMTRLRCVLAGDARIKLDHPWREIHHTYGEFEIDGWRIIAYRRSFGIKYIDSATAPDGRWGNFDSWEAREGNPVTLLTDDEQDALDELIEGIDV